MNKSDKKKQAFALVNFMFEPGSDKSVIKNDLKKLILGCGYSEPVEELFHKCWREFDRISGDYYSGFDSDANATKVFRDAMTFISFIDLSELE